MHGSPFDFLQKQLSDPQDNEFASVHRRIYRVLGAYELSQCLPGRLHGISLQRQLASALNDFERTVRACESFGLCPESSAIGLADDAPMYNRKYCAELISDD